MQITSVTEAGPGAVANEDFVATGPGWVVVLDGATAHPAVVSGCEHTVAWLVRRLGGALAWRLAQESGAPLTGLLADAITEVSTAHSGTCDLANPDSPSSTVSLLRRHDDRWDWLVLADSPIVLETGDGLRVVHDDRVGALHGRTVEAVRAARNAPDGFWVAAARPEAAYEAVTGELPAAAVRRAAVFSDGGSRLVERFGLLDWQGLLDLADTGGPAEVIRRTREAETSLTSNGHGKRYDDATVVLIRP